MTVELSSEEIGEACAEYALKKLGGSGKFTANVALKCEPGKPDHSFSASVTLKMAESERPK